MRRICRPGLKSQGITPAIRSWAAFTLIEVVVVLAIVSILAGMAIPRFANSLARQRAESAARRVAADLEFASRRAAQMSSAVTVTFNTTTHSYELDGVDNPDRPGNRYKVYLALPPYRARIVSADFGGTAKVAFDGYGHANSSGTVIINGGDIDQTIIFDKNTARAEVN
ncbi:MAG: prepilin-type N-terminal cleavage/methylation domain-containing protein [Phycisphaerae bacterium]|nr:prepilin-type N-terminal cleavage/methylation domain-containing protein [Phycisphaerae bacterium]